VPRPPEVTPPPRVLPPVGPVSSADANPAADEMNPLPRQHTTFSRTTGEITDQVRPQPEARMRRSRYAFGLLGVVAAAALVVLLVRPHSPSVVTAASMGRIGPVAAPVVTAAPSISPLASTPTFYAGETGGAANSYPTAKSTLRKSHMTGGAGPAETRFDRKSGKRKTASVPKAAAAPLQPRVKRTIIREL
jgi:hypothetical protein